MLIKFRLAEPVSHGPYTASSSSYHDVHTRTLPRSTRAHTPYRSYDTEPFSYDSTKHFHSTNNAADNYTHSSTVSEYDYLRRTFSPTRDSSSRYSHASSGRGPATFQQPSTYRPAIDRLSAHRSFDSSLASATQTMRTNVRSRHRAYNNRYNMIRSKSANPPDRDVRRNGLYCASNLDYSYRPERYDRYELYTARRPLYNPNVSERRVTQNSDIKLMHNVMADDASIKWFRNDKELPKSSRCRSIYRDGLAMLEIFSAQLADTAKYTCVARNKLGYSSFSSHLKVFPDSSTEPLPPIFTRAVRGNTIEPICVCLHLNVSMLRCSRQTAYFLSKIKFPQTPTI